MFLTLFFSLVSLSFSLAFPAGRIVQRAAAGSPDCKGVTVLFARGTTELGLLGAVVGPFLEDALDEALPGQVTVTGVDYPASITGFLLGGDEDGAQTMADLAQTTVDACADEKIVITGYSQGAQVARLAVDILPDATKSRISAIVLFGDPNNGEAFGDGLDTVEKTFCNDGDNICDGGVLVLPPHFLYGLDAGDAADFIASKV